MRLLTACLLLPLSGCSCGAAGGGVKATVHFGDTDAVCARVFVTGRNDHLVASLPLVRSNKDYEVGVAQEDNIGPSIDLQARGYGTGDCTGPFVDSSNVEHRDLKPGKVAPEAVLVLNGGSHAIDGGSDAGFDAGSDAGLDGGLADGGTPEQCTNSVDDDGDGKVDCFDGDCLQKDCGFGKRCTSIGVCEVPKTELNCADGLDDDMNGLTDCADPTCNNRSCADSNACTYGEKCVGFACTPSLTLTCNAPTECQVAGTGACLTDAGCGYTARSGTCDGGSCANGECVVGFPYTPSNFSAAIPASGISVKVTLNCGTSKFNSDTNLFTNWCGRPTPTPRIVNRIGVQNIVVLPMAGFDLQDRLELTGSHPVILAVYGDANIDGDLIASGVGALSGAGGPADGCPFNLGAGGDGFVFSGGGGGGAAYSQNGTKGGGVQASALVGGNGGLLSVTQPEVTLRGGCSGGDGAIVTSGQVSAKGGGAGGGVQISASGTFTVNGKVAANGGGGEGGTGTRAGAGGGGSGGGIVLEASLLHLKSNAVLTSQGGGGGGGARNDDDGAPGANGHDNDASPANGGGGAGNEGGNGGKGGASANPTLSTDGTTNGANVGGGGGGGGGAGRIYLRSALSTCALDTGKLVSPTATGNCP